MILLTVMLLACASALLLAGLLYGSSAVVRDQRGRRNEPRDPVGELEFRRRFRREKVKITGSLLFGRWAEDGHRDVTRDE